MSKQRTGGIGDSPQGHAKGGYRVLVGMQQRHLEHGLEGTVDLTGRVCRVDGHSSHGVHVSLIDQHRRWVFVVDPSNLNKMGLPPAGATAAL